MTPWTPAAYDTLDAILGDLDEADISASDRRRRAADKIVEAHALRGGTSDAAMLDRWLVRASVAYLPHFMRRQLLTFCAPTRQRPAKAN